jgi:hypothetical protein
MRWGFARLGEKLTVTIATCYVSPEGVVLGADSTSTVGTPGNFHYFNHAQKLFELGENSTLGAVTWGLGGLVVSSHRMLLAKLADDFAANPPATVIDAANRWAASFWTAYTNTAPLMPLIQRCRVLHAKPALIPMLRNRTQRPRAKAEEDELKQTRGKSFRRILCCGLCSAKPRGRSLRIDVRPGAPSQFQQISRYTA